MAHPEDPRIDDDLDHKLRRALEPSPDSVDRVVRAALEDRTVDRQRERSSERGWRPAWVAAALLGLSGGLWLSSGVRDLGTEPELGPPKVIAPQPVFHMSNESGFVTVSTPHGTRWVLLPDGSPPDVSSPDVSSPEGTTDAL